MLNIQPKNKNALLESLRKTQIDSFITKDNITKNDTQNLKKELDRFIGAGNKIVSIVIIKES
jgi:hypothetical protein